MLVSYALGCTVIGSLFVGFIVVGYCAVNLSLIRTKTAKVETLFGGCGNFVTNFVAYLLMQIFIALWSFLFIIPGIVKSCSYAMTCYILNDHPEMSATEAITESRKMMNINLIISFSSFPSLAGLFFPALHLVCSLFVLSIIWKQRTPLFTKSSPQSKNNPANKKCTSCGVHFCYIGRN